MIRQVQIAGDFAKGVAARLAGVEVPKYEDTEKTFAELQARIAKTIDFVMSLHSRRRSTAAKSATSADDRRQGRDVQGPSTT